MTPVIAEKPRNRTPAGHKADFYNIATIVTDSVGWNLGNAFLATTTVIPSFLMQLHTGYMEIALVPTIISFGYYMPGILSVNTVRKQPYAGPFLFKVGLCERVPLFLIAFAVFFLGSSRRELLLPVFYFLLMSHAITLGLNQPAYWSVVEKIVPANVRGRAFGIAGLIAGLLALGVEPAMKTIFGASSGLNGYGFCFLIAAIIILISFLPYSAIREDALPPRDQSERDAPPWQIISSVWRSDRSYRRLVWLQCGASVWTCAAVFFLAAAQQKIHSGVQLAAACASIGAAAGALGNLGWGYWADKKGNKIVLIFASIILIAGTLIAFVAWSDLAYELLFAFTALGNGGIGIAGGNMLLELTPSKEQTPAYLGAMNTLLAIPRSLAPLIGGAVAMRAGLNAVFVLASLAAALSLVAAIQMREPRRAARKGILTPHTRS